MLALGVWAAAPATASVGADARLNVLRERRGVALGALQHQWYVPQGGRLAVGRNGGQGRFASLVTTQTRLAMRRNKPNPK